MQRLIQRGGASASWACPEGMPALIKGAYEEVFSALKPDDFAAIGVFQRDGNQVRQNADLYREWYSEKA